MLVISCQDNDNLLHRASSATSAVSCHHFYRRKPSLTRWCRNWNPPLADLRLQTLRLIQLLRLTHDAMLTNNDKIKHWDGGLIMTTGSNHNGMSVLPWGSVTMFLLFLQHCTSFTPPGQGMICPDRRRLAEWAILIVRRLRRALLFVQCSIYSTCAWHERTAAFSTR